MRELTVHDLDAESAEQLPARELMGGRYGGFRVTNIAVAGNNNGNWSGYFATGHHHHHEQLPARELTGGGHGGVHVTNIALAGNNNGGGSISLFQGNQDHVVSATIGPNVAVAG